MPASRTSRGTKLVLVAAVCFCLPATGRADVFPFGLGYDVEESADEADEKSSAPLPLRLEADDSSLAHRIVIPAAVLAKLADVPLGGRRTTWVSTTRSVVAGVALSAAVACGFVAYRRGRATRIPAVMLIGATVAGAGIACFSSAWADVPPAIRRESLRVPMPRRHVVDVVTLRQGARVIVEIAADGEDTIIFAVGNFPLGEQAKQPPRHAEAKE